MSYPLREEAIYNQIIEWIDKGLTLDYKNAVDPNSDYHKGLKQSLSDLRRYLTINRDALWRSLPAYEEAATDKERELTRCIEYCVARYNAAFNTNGPVWRLAMYNAALAEIIDPNGDILPEHRQMARRIFLSNRENVQRFNAWLSEREEVDADQFPTQAGLRERLHALVDYWDEVKEMGINA